MQFGTKHCGILVADIDVAPKASPIRHLQSGNEPILMKILQFGRELRAMNNRLNETLGTNEANNAMLEVCMFNMKLAPSM